MLKEGDFLRLEHDPLSAEEARICPEFVRTVPPHARRCPGAWGDRGIACFLALCGVMGPHPRTPGPGVPDSSMGTRRSRGANHLWGYDDARRILGSPAGVTNDSAAPRPG